MHRLSQADYIIALDNDGEIDERGTFARLNNTDGYTSSLALTDRAPKALPKVTDNRLANLIGVTPPTNAPGAQQEKTDIHAGDLTIYRYYIETFGWVNWAIFTSICIVYGFGTAFPSKSSRRHTCAKFSTDLGNRRMDQMVGGVQHGPPE